METLNKKAELTKDLPDPTKMESVPDELPAPASLGGSILDGVTVAPEDEAGDVDVDDGTISSLADRAADEKEDMDERNEWQRQVDASIEAEDSTEEELEPSEEIPEVEEQE